MRNIAVALFILVCFSCEDKPNPLTYTPVNQELHDEIAAMDKLFFDAYNECDLETQAAIYSDKIEFIHDQSGLSTSKTEIIESTKKYICGKVTRTLVEGTIEVYPINSYGAVEIGFHKFFNSEEPDAPSKPSKFILFWNNTSGNWIIDKVVSLH